jgi:hypothetical protein
MKSKAITINVTVFSLYLQHNISCRKYSPLLLLAVSVITNKSHLVLNWFNSVYCRNKPAFSVWIKVINEGNDFEVSHKIIDFH